MKKILCFLILIVSSAFLFVACNNSQILKKTNLDFSVELESDNSILEVFTLNLDSDKYTDEQSLCADKVLILSYFLEDTIYYLNQFDRLVSQSTYLSDEIKEEYLTRRPIEYESKNINNSNCIQFEMHYKNNNMRQVWYFFIQSYDIETNSGIILDYKDEELFENPTTPSEVVSQYQEGTWFTKEYILTSSFYNYAFVPYPTFKTNFVDVVVDVSYTQTMISSDDNLRTNAYSETDYGDVVKRTWVIDLNNENPIEYYILQANRSSWYLLALSISLIAVIIMFVSLGVHKINLLRQKNYNR